MNKQSNMNNKLNSLWVIFMLIVSIFSVTISMNNKDIYSDVDTSDIKSKLMKIEFQANNNDTSYKWNELYQPQIYRIVIHHTATPANQNVYKLFDIIQRDHAARWKRWWVDKTWQQMMYHRLIWSDWRIVWNKDFNEIWWWTRESNIWSIHIALQWNFNNAAPTESQYDTLSQVISSIRSRYWSWIVIIWHWQLEKEHTAYPWKLFDRKKINSPVIEEINKKSINDMHDKIKDWYTMFSLSRYYSPVVWQKRYYNWRTYEADVTMNCWKSAIGNDWCLYPSSWKKYSLSDKNKSVACSPKYPIWTKFELDIDWTKIIVKCEDRWWAIQNNRLDMYCWIWDHALDNRKTCITWQRWWKVIK